MEPKKTLRVLIFGKDARTDAIIVACDRSHHKPDICVRTEFKNPRLRTVCRKKEFVSIGSLTNMAEMCDFAKKVSPDLAIIGPEEPLAIGLVDELERLGIPTFGPCKAAARIESSKAWTRQLLSKYQGWLNPEFRVFDSAEDLPAYLESLGGFVIKPDGLTGGKGVRLSGEHLRSTRDAVAYAHEVLQNHGVVVVEEKLEGEEFSLQTITDGESFVHCPIAQDHKRAGEGDQGLNTGGMGSYTCPDGSLPFLRETDVETARSANSLVIEAIRSETGTRYRGVLYGNYIATRDGVKLIEYNSRFADPEALNVLPILKTDFVDICIAAANSTLKEIAVEFDKKATVCKYVVPRGYPQNPVRGERIKLGGREDSGNLKTFFAAVNQEGDDLLLTGSRAVAFVGIADRLEDAERFAEEAACSVEGPVCHRRDIGTRRLIDARVAHMERLRAVILDDAEGRLRTVVSR